MLVHKVTIFGDYSLSMFLPKETEIRRGVFQPGLSGIVNMPTTVSAASDE
jgi:hypothetical protein